jgi:recombination protein RecA
VIQKAGSWFSFGDTRLGQGKEKTAAYLTEHPETLEAVQRAVLETLQGPSGAVFTASPADDEESEPAF